MRDDADGGNVHDAYCDPEADALSEKELGFRRQVKWGERVCKCYWSVEFIVHKWQGSVLPDNIAQVSL